MRCWTTRRRRGASRRCTGRAAAARLPDRARRLRHRAQARRAAPALLEGWSADRAALRAGACCWRRARTAAPGAPALQLVSRAGVVSEAELIEFRSAVETLGAKARRHGVRARDARRARGGARARPTCADSDIQVALHVIGQGDRAARPASSRSRWCGARTASRWCSTSRVTPGPRRAATRRWRAPAAASPASHGARLVDDRGNALDERALAAIGAQLEAVRQTLAGHGIETGSPLALRLFS